MTILLDNLDYTQRALIMLIALGAAAGVAGVLVNLRCLEFSAEACVHAIFPGVVAGALYGGFDAIIPAASVVAVFVVIALTAVQRKTGVNEAGVAVVLTSFFSLGIVLSLKKGDMSGQLEALMFGRLLEVTPTRLLESLAICVVATAVLLLTWRSQVFIAFDRNGAQAAGIPVRMMDYLVNGAIAAIVVAASSAVGVLLVIGYLVIPGAAARLLARSVSGMIGWSMAVGIAGGIVGVVALDLPTTHPISPQASVALATVLMFAIAVVVSKRRRGGARA